MKTGETPGALSQSAKDTKQEKSIARPSAESTSPVGEVDEISGAVELLRARGGLEMAKKRFYVYLGDVVHTKADGKIKIILKDEPERSASSEMIVMPNSRIMIEKVQRESEGGRVPQVTLNLLLGKVRNRIHKKYEVEERFRVKTPSAVAGVRGTDFVTSYEQGEKEWITEVRTIEGEVQLGSPDRDQLRLPDSDSFQPKKVAVSAGNYAAFIVESPSKGANEADINVAISKGSLTAIFQMKPEDIRLLREATDLKPIDAKRDSLESATRFPASRVAGDELCNQPNGLFNQCSWTCEGNPKGENTCRTDLSEVKCVRRLCRANGQWSEATRLPAAQGNVCQGEQVVVDDCGNYW